ncbi:MAG: metal-dependent hydrolase [Deltaproteobacteria bacterium]|nr:metal-dependent hydrolase [Deltaproteobacteria bacterium]
MAQYQTHISFSVVSGAAYAFMGYSMFHIFPEHLLLAFILVVIAGMLPDLDASHGMPARELSGLLAALAPVILFEHYPNLRTAGSARMSLVFIVCYLLTRILSLRTLQIFTTHRGMIHSLPATIIVFQLSYFLFSDLYWKDQVYLAGAIGFGFLSHLVLDGYTNLDILGTAMGKRSGGAPALKILAPTWGLTFFIYGIIAALGYVMSNDYFPQIRLQKTKTETKAEIKTEVKASSSSATAR